MVAKKIMSMMLLSASLTLAACAENTEETLPNETTQEERSAMTDHNMDSIEEMQNHEAMNEMDHSSMNHSGSGEVPDGLKAAENPTFPVGSKGIIQSDHMGGMKGAEATIVGAYNTTVYTVSYTPTMGGAPITNHKWVIHEELEGVAEAPLEPGTEVKMNADHMEGMHGATATIDSAEETTVYMVDFTSITGEQITNHKWVTESELSAIE
ncbi:YdhK family protein [Lysinibacillus sp. LZ02]|uniref:YdhK family protein n=1 Tax=Lysinibacillus sp. LZ02 TaxID=3420668 RepID=UPI003D369BA8